MNKMYAVSQTADYGWLEPWGIIAAVLLFLVLWMRFLLRDPPKRKKK